MEVNAEGMKIINRYDEEYWATDVETAERAVERYVEIELTENQFSALVSLVVNIGVREFMKSALLHLVNKEQLLCAAQQFHEYTTLDQLTEDKTLARRRRAEKKLFLRPTLVEKTERPK